nr:hypothetical protein [Pseudomonas sp. D(2018)]
MNTHHHVHGLAEAHKLRLTEKVIASNPAKRLVINGLLVLKQPVNPPLLPKIRQRLKETGLTQMHAVTLAVML